MINRSQRMCCQCLLFIELLERVFLRIASAETDDQLEKTVGNFLSPILLKVASPHQEVKNKVNERTVIIFSETLWVDLRSLVFN